MKLIRNLVTMFSITNMLPKLKTRSNILRAFSIPTLHQASSILSNLTSSPHQEVIDVRSPSEFIQDHFPGAINLPVLSDLERHEIGCVYKQDKFEAKRKGAALVARNIAHHLDIELACKPKQYAPLVYCWRGGLRSQAMALVLNQVGWRANTLSGGYKTYRSEVRNVFSEIAPTLKLYVLSGMTGVGKTKLLKHMKMNRYQVIDLEGLAAHRGSALGKFPDEDPQPSQKYFESLLAHEILKLDKTKPVWIESESSRIGKVQIPKEFWKNMHQSSRIVVNLSLDKRVENILKEYSYWIKHPDQLASVLLRYRESKFGTSLVSRWLELIKEDRWVEFVHSLLKYYDSSYKNRQSVVMSIELNSLYPDDLLHFLSKVNQVDNATASTEIKQDGARKS